MLYSIRFCDFLSFKKKSLNTLNMNNVCVKIYTTYSIYFYICIELIREIALDKNLNLACLNSKMSIITQFWRR